MGEQFGIAKLTREFALLLCRNIPNEKKFGNGSIKRCLSVDFMISDAERALPLNTISERILLPAVTALINAITSEEKVRCEMLESPQNKLVDAERYDGVAVRGSFRVGEPHIAFDITTC